MGHKLATCDYLTPKLKGVYLKEVKKVARDNHSDDVHPQAFGVQPVMSKRYHAAVSYGGE